MSFFKRKKKEIQPSSIAHNSLIKIIPNYRGYEILNNRKITDEAIRGYFASLILDLKNKFTKINTILLTRKMLNVWNLSSVVLKKLEEINVLMTASMDDVYGHSTFFDSEKIEDWIEVSVFYVLETESLSFINQIQQQIDEVLEYLQHDKIFSIEKSLLDLKKNIDEVYYLLHDRAELISSFEIMIV